MTSEEKVGCRTPAEGREGVTNIAKWKFNLLRGAILASVQVAGAEGLRFSDLKEAVRPRLSEEELDTLGSLGWHVTTVKLELEVRGELKRLAIKGPQRVVLG